MGRLSEESSEREDLLREIETDLDSDLGLDREESLRTRTTPTSSTKGKLTPLNFAAYAVGAAAAVWVVLKLIPIVWFLAKWVILIAAIGWFVLWWMGRKRR